MVEKFCQHIEKLLAHYDYVVVPGLGGFVVQVQSATVMSGHIAPPVATVGFNPLMCHADGLLAIEISRSQQIAYRQAVGYIEREVGNIRQKLEVSGSVRLGSIGVLQQDADGNFVFQPQAKAAFLPQNLGLSDLYVGERPESSNVARRIAFTLPSPRMFRYAASILLVAGLFLVSNRVSDVRQPNTASLASLSFMHAPPAVKIPVQLSSDTTVLPVEEKPVEIARFHVVVASLPTCKSADHLCASLKEKFPEAHVLEPAKIYRVAVRSFSDRDEAIRYMEQLRLSDSEFENAWVLCN
ncbi:MAG TPA: SPOR domain-containing protein [Paludibacter sp.]|nr:SPOR domain-containing protein [Paludibacter sp.]